MLARQPVYLRSRYIDVTSVTSLLAPGLVRTGAPGLVHLVHPGGCAWCGATGTGAPGAPTRAFIITPNIGTPGTPGTPGLDQYINSLKPVSLCRLPW